MHCCFHWFPNPSFTSNTRFTNNIHEIFVYHTCSGFLIALTLVNNYTNIHCIFLGAMSVCIDFKRVSYWIRSKIIWFVWGMTFLCGGLTAGLLSLDRWSTFCIIYHTWAQWSAWCLNHAPLGLLEHISLHTRPLSHLHSYFWPSNLHRN